MRRRIIRVMDRMCIMLFGTDNRRHEEDRRMEREILMAMGVMFIIFVTASITLAVRVIENGY